MGSNGNGGGPCGACKFLRRKCVKGCVFAPYFDPDQGTTHFAAVHKVFGASNAAKLLLRIPASRRLDAVVTICYQALARVRDPVYGCVAHIFTLQQQVLNLQAELAYVQARLAILQRLPPQSLSPSPASNLPPSPKLVPSSSPPSACFEHALFGQASLEMPGFSNCNNGIIPLADVFEEGGELEMLAHEFLTRYLPGVKIQPPCSP